MANMSKRFLDLRAKLRERLRADEWEPKEVLEAMALILDCLDDLRDDLGDLRRDAGFE